jgi:PilZ domain-containing protein
MHIGSYRKRDARVSVRCDALLTEADGCELEVLITDVSRDGFKLESRSELEIGEEVLLRVEKLAPVRAIIRWTCGREAGGVFLEPVAL